MKSVYYKWHGGTKKSCRWRTRDSSDICKSFPPINKSEGSSLEKRLAAGPSDTKKILATDTEHMFLQPGCFWAACTVMKVKHKGRQPKWPFTCSSSSYIITAMANKIHVVGGDESVHSEWLQSLKTPHVNEPEEAQPQLSSPSVCHMKKVHIWWPRLKCSPASSYRKHAPYKVKVWHILL